MNNNILTFTEFTSLIKNIEECVETVHQNDLYLEDLFDLFDSKNIMLEEVVTGDIAQTTLPIMNIKRKTIYEVAPPGKKAEDWVLSNKARFKKEYGKDWEQVLYATAWKLFPKDK